MLGETSSRRQRARQRYRPLVGRPRGQVPQTPGRILPQGSPDRGRVLPWKRTQVEFEHHLIP